MVEEGEEGAALVRSGVSMGEIGALCTETETTKQLLLNFLQTNAAADVAADAAQTHMLCEWHAAATEGQKSLLCDLYFEQQSMALRARKRARERSGEAVEKQRALLSREGVLQAGRRLMSECGLFDKIEKMLTHLLSVLRDPSATCRAKAIKALRDIVKAEPAVLSLRIVIGGVKLALGDPSTSVREGVLDLLGNFLATTAGSSYVAHYYPIIVSRITDPGVSVRKRVIKILRDICVNRPTDDAEPGAAGSSKDPVITPSPRTPRAPMTAAQRSIDACCYMVTRLGPSEEDEVHKLVLNTFHELWFDSDGRRESKKEDKKGPLPADEARARGVASGSATYCNACSIRMTGRAA